MNTYELLFGRTNLELMKGKEFSNSEKQEISKSLLSAVSSEDTVNRFYKGVKTDNNKMYPMFYIPPYNDDKKLRLITGELPKTHILAANHYELEILRILALFDKDNLTVKNMIDKTIERLDATCYAHWCAAGECVGAGISVLRFLASIHPQKEEWINHILTPLIKLENGGKGGTYYAKVNIPFYYMLAAVADIANELCIKFVYEKKEWLMKMLGLTELTKTSIMIPKARAVRANTPDEYNIERYCVMKNALSILPEFDYLKNIK